MRRNDARPTRARTKAPPRKKRVRRDPVESKSLLLDAAERVFVTYLPDEVGLKEIAKEAGVSHALLGHHFGTYEAFVEATLARRLDTLTRKALESFVTLKLQLDGEPPLVDIMIELMSDPLSVRLISWSLLSGHAARNDYVFARTRGLALVADMIESALRATPLKVTRQSIDFSVMTGLGIAIGLGIAGPALHRALGHDDAFDPRALRRDMADMTRGYMMLASMRANQKP